MILSWFGGCEEIWAAKADMRRLFRRSKDPARYFSQNQSAQKSPGEMDHTICSQPMKRKGILCRKGVSLHVRNTRLSCLFEVGGSCGDGSGSLLYFASPRLPFPSIQLNQRPGIQINYTRLLLLLPDLEEF
jgi:hypothetical protein